MNAQVSWLDGFVKWFFNASPVWFDERRVALEPGIPGQQVDRRSRFDDRRRDAVVVGRQSSKRGSEA